MENRIYTRTDFKICTPNTFNKCFETICKFNKLPSYKKIKQNGRIWEHLKTYEPYLDRIIIDVDDSNLDNALKETKQIYGLFKDYKDYINVYFSGKKGFHVEILTEKLNIIDTSTDKPSESVKPYLEFLTGLNKKFNTVDKSLKDGATRLIRTHKSQHQDTGNYKILVNLNASLESIQAHSRLNNDMRKSVTKRLPTEQALKLLEEYGEPIETEEPHTPNNEKTVINANEDKSIFSKVFNDLTSVGATEEKHQAIGLLGSAVNGYVNKSDLEDIYQELTKNTNIEDSTNAKKSLINAFERDSEHNNMGQLYNYYKNNDLDFTNFYALSRFLKNKQIIKGYNEFTVIMQENKNDLFKMYETKLVNYVDNTENVIKGVINGVGALMGYLSRFIPLNAGSEVGKSEYINTIDRLMPDLKDLGSSTPASVRRSDKHAFDKKIVYLGDKGLKGTDNEEFKGLMEVFGGLITEGKFRRDIVIGDSIYEFDLKSDGVLVFYSEPYTNLNVHKAGDQYKTRSTYITINPVKDGLSVFLQSRQDDTFYNIHKNYIKYIINNPIALNISDDIKTEIYSNCHDSLRTAYYILGLFQAYCQFKRIENPTIDTVNIFMDIFKPTKDVNDIEYLIYKKLYNNLHKIRDEDEIIFMVHDYEGEPKSEHVLKQTKNRKQKSFFTAKQIKTYFRQDFKRNKNLKDTLDSVPEILNNLFNAGYLKRLEYQDKGQNIYYIPYMEEMEDN